MLEKIKRLSPAERFPSFLETYSLSTIMCCFMFKLGGQVAPAQVIAFIFSDGGFAPKARSRSPTSDGKRAWVMYVCMYICMFFTYISQFTAHTEFKSVPFASPLMLHCLGMNLVGYGTQRARGT